MNRIWIRSILGMSWVAVLLGCAGESPLGPAPSLRAPAAFEFKAVATVAFETPADSMCLGGDVTYLGSLEERSIRVLDTTLLDAPELIATIRDVHPSAIAFSEDRLFVVEPAHAPLGLGVLGDSPRLLTFDVLDPAAPAALESKPLANACALAAYAARACVGAGSRVLVGAEGKQPFSLRPDASDDVRVVGLGWRGDRLAVVHVRRGSLLADATAQLTLYSGRRPVRAGACALPVGSEIGECGACSVELTPGRVWIGARDRVIGVDVSNPAAPRVVRTWPLLNLRAMTIFDSYLVTVGDEIRVFHLDDLAECTVAFDVPPKAPRAIQVRDSMAYVATERGFEVFSITTRPTAADAADPKSEPPR